MLTYPAVLQHYHPYPPVELHTGASGEEIGAVLAQRTDDAPMENAVAYASRTPSKAERN